VPLPFSGRFWESLSIDCTYISSEEGERSMPFILGVDGGATKTIAVVGDHTGQILSAGLSGPTNYQITGLDAAMQNLDAAVKMAVSGAGIDVEQISVGVFGLAGADYPIDFHNLTRGTQELYPYMKFEIANDTWVGFRSGTDQDYGGVVISGTGANFAAAAPDGKRVTGRGISYEWGGEGGARALIRTGFHFAFRSHDGTGPKTALEDIVLSVLGFPSYDELSFYMYQIHGQFSRLYKKAAPIVPAIFQLANEGDKVCANILIESGKAMGEIMGRMIETLGSGRLPQDVVMVGSLFTKGASPLLIDSFSMSCHRFVPFARFKMPEVEPAGGAYIMGLEKTGINTKGKIRARAIATFPEVPVPEPGP
jgi:N-acetylglucosamine kinase-like BadF-type ATPase